MLTILHLPLADLAETLRVVMPIIFVVIYGVAHLVGAFKRLDDFFLALEEEWYRDNAHGQHAAFACDACHYR